jgi:hypothetical protein
MKLKRATLILLVSSRAFAETSAGTEPVVAQPLGIALVSTSAFGVTHAKFFNQLVGPRLDYRLTPRFSADGALSYANLKGKEGRASNVLPELGIAYRMPLPSERVTLPLGYAMGFLPRNGPTLRLSGGLEVALSRAVSLELVPLEAMVWVTRDRPELSFDLTLGLRLSP